MIHGKNESFVRYWPRQCENSGILEANGVELQFSLKIALKWSFQHHFKVSLIIKDSHIYHQLCQSRVFTQSGPIADLESGYIKRLFVAIYESSNFCNTLTIKDRFCFHFLSEVFSECLLRLLVRFFDNYLYTSVFCSA